jgi:hypothetical protein
MKPKKNGNPAKENNIKEKEKTKNLLPIKLLN